MVIEKEREQIQANHYVEHVALEGNKGNQKAVVTPCDEYARHKLEQKDWSDYTVFVEVQ